MKEKLVGSRITGFSTLEIVIAFALMITVIVGAVNANIASQYWLMTSQTATEGLYKAKTIIETLRSVSSTDFQSASSTSLSQSLDITNPIDISCITGGLCFWTKSKVTDVSSCSKYAEASVQWRIAKRYATSTVTLYTNLTNNNEIIANGGDCTLNPPAGNWLQGVPLELDAVSLSPQLTTGIDVFQKRVYLSSATTPQLKIYSAPVTNGVHPVLLGSATGTGRRLNAVDAIAASTGRVYVYAATHASTSQLTVFDVTNPTLPVLITKRSLSGVVSTGSFPEGWRVVAYGNRIYTTTRETSGPELHIFNSSIPTAPTEIITAKTELNRTVNEMVVREQIITGVPHRYLFAVAKAGNKEFAVFDVTNDAVFELIAINLPGSVDAMSLYLVGNRIYVGRANDTAGPELFVFDVRQLLAGIATPLATSEVGTDVTTLKVTGDVIFMGTAKSGQEFQVWKSDYTTWNRTVINAGRISSMSMPHLAPLGMDFGGNFVYLQSQSSSATEFLKRFYKP